MGLVEIGEEVGVGVSVAGACVTGAWEIGACVAGVGAAVVVGVVDQGQLNPPEGHVMTEIGAEVGAAVLGAEVVGAEVGADVAGADVAGADVADGARRGVWAFNRREGEVELRVTLAAAATKRSRMVDTVAPGNA